MSVRFWRSACRFAASIVYASHDACDMYRAIPIQTDGLIRGQFELILGQELVLHQLQEHFARVVA